MKSDSNLKSITFSAPKKILKVLPCSGLVIASEDQYGLSLFNLAALPKNTPLFKLAPAQQLISALKVSKCQKIFVAQLRTSIIYGEITSTSLKQLGKIDADNEIKGSGIIETRQGMLIYALSVSGSLISYSINQNIQARTSYSKQISYSGEVGSVIYMISNSHYSILQPTISDERTQFRQTQFPVNLKQTLSDKQHIFKGFVLRKTLVVITRIVKVFAREIFIYYSKEGNLIPLASQTAVKTSNNTNPNGIKTSLSTTHQQCHCVIVRNNYALVYISDNNSVHLLKQEGEVVDIIYQKELALDNIIELNYRVEENSIIVYCLGCDGMITFTIDLEEHGMVLEEEQEDWEVEESGGNVGGFRGKEIDLSNIPLAVIRESSMEESLSEFETEEKKRRRNPFKAKEETETQPVRAKAFHNPFRVTNPQPPSDIQKAQTQPFGNQSHFPSLPEPSVNKKEYISSVSTNPFVLTSSQIPQSIPQQNPFLIKVNALPKTDFIKQRPLVFPQNLFKRMELPKVQEAPKIIQPPSPAVIQPISVPLIQKPPGGPKIEPNPYVININPKMILNPLLPTNSNPNSLLPSVGGTILQREIDLPNVAIKQTFTPSKHDNQQKSLYSNNRGLSERGSFQFHSPERNIQNTQSERLHQSQISYHSLSPTEHNRLMKKKPSKGDIISLKGSSKSPNTRYKLQRIATKQPSLAFLKQFYPERVANQQEIKPELMIQSKEESNPLLQSQHKPPLVLRNQDSIMISKMLGETKKVGSEISSVQAIKKSPEENVQLVDTGKSKSNLVESILLSDKTENKNDSLKSPQEQQITKNQQVQPQTGQKKEEKPQPPLQPPSQPQPQPPSQPQTTFQQKIKKDFQILYPLSNQHINPNYIISHPRKYINNLSYSQDEIQPTIDKIQDSESLLTVFQIFQRSIYLMRKKLKSCSKQLDKELNFEVNTRTELIKMNQRIDLLMLNNDVSEEDVRWLGEVERSLGRQIEALRGLRMCFENKRVGLLDHNKQPGESKSNAPSNITEYADIVSLIKESQQAHTRNQHTKQRIGKYLNSLITKGWRIKREREFRLTTSESDKWSKASETPSIPTIIVHPLNYSNTIYL